VLRALRHREVDSKSNEITAVPELLDTLHLDAMGCQKDDIAGALYHKRTFMIPLALDIGRRKGKRDPDGVGMALSPGYCRDRRR
jgi:predicted transposase YbfD/YdcC